MRPTLRQALLGSAFLIVYGVVVFAATRAYYLERPAAARPAPAAPGAGPRPFALPQSAPPPALADDPVALAGQADELFTQKRYGEAIVAYRKLLDRVPGDADAHNDLGLALFYAGRTAEALQVLEQGAAQNAGFQRLWLTLGFVRLQAGRDAQARAALETCIAIDPGSPLADEARRFLARLP